MSYYREPQYDIDTFTVTCRYWHDEEHCPSSSERSFDCLFDGEVEGAFYLGMFTWTCPCCGIEQEKAIY